MKPVEILIGRQVQGDNILVPSKYEKVSRMHAKIVRNQNGLFVEDLDSANGTFVNGVRVKTKRITEKDSISLGGAGYYEVNLQEVLEKMPMSDEEFTARMYKLKDVYENYQQESSRLQASGQESMMSRRMMPSLVLGLLTTIVTVMVEGDPAIKAIIGIAGGVLAIVVFIFASKWATSSSKEMKQELQRLNESFELDYVCPACGASLRGRSWEFIKRQGMCPACKRHFG